jgi:hypothetical protein
MFGMREFASFREIIDLWPTRTELARQMSWGLRVVSAANVRVMYQRDRIGRAGSPRCCAPPSTPGSMTSPSRSWNASTRPADARRR